MGRLIYKQAKIAGVSVVTFAVLSAGVSYALARGYASDDTGIRPGMAVSLSDESTAAVPKVERTTTENNGRVIGIAVNPEENLITTGSSGQVVYVQTEGETDVYASDLNGVPHKGDFLAASPLKGVLVRADSTSNMIVGTALEDFSTDEAVQQQIETTTEVKAVSIDKLAMNLDNKGSGITQDDSSLERLGRSIVGKDVGEIRVVVALIIFVIVLIAEGNIIYGAVSSAITALGRNPLARKVIVKELARVILIAVGVMIVGLTAIYIILWI